MTNKAIGVTKLRAKYSGEKQLIFNDLTLSIPHGQKLLLLGPSGCGKSTLLQIISGIIPGAVQIPLLAEQITKPESWGFVFQDPDTQFCMSYVDEELAFVLENQLIPQEQMKQLIEEALEHVQLHLPKLHTPIAELSQGMKQRLALAAVLLLKPDVVFLDEPSALLDPEGKQYIWETIRSTLAQHTVIVVEHHIDGILDWFDRVVVLNRQGDIIADGHPSHVFAEQKSFLMQEGIWYPNIWEEYFSYQSNSLSLAFRAEATAELQAQPNISGSQPLLELQNFKVKRGAYSLVVPYAAAQQGDWIAIRGANGAGKSTLLFALARLLASNGSYRIQGEDVGEDIPPSMSYVFQNPELQFITDRIIDEVTHSLIVKYDKERTEKEQGEHWIKRLFAPKQRKSRIDLQQLTLEASAALEQLQLSVPPDRHPYELSIGQKRRLSVLTALVENRSILLLDEPTFGQDARSTFIMLEWLQQLQASGVTIMMITHDEQIMRRFATQIWHIEHGTLTTCSPAQALYSKEADDEQLTQLVHT